MLESDAGGSGGALIVDSGVTEPHQGLRCSCCNIAMKSTIAKRSEQSGCCVACFIRAASEPEVFGVAGHVLSQGLHRRESHPPLLEVAHIDVAPEQRND